MERNRSISSVTSVGWLVTCVRCSSALVGGGVYGGERKWGWGRG